MIKAILIYIAEITVIMIAISPLLYLAYKAI